MQPSLQGYVVEGLPIIKPGDDIAALIESFFNIQDGDILCLASTVVAKSEGRLRTLESYRPSERAERIARQVGKDSRFVQAVLDESADVLLEEPFLLTKTRFGHIGVNAGIDQSNVGGGRILLLPEDPSKSAEKLRRSLNKNCAVIITDTCGRPFRCGVTGVAIGWAGISALQDWRGKRDMHGKVLEITLEAVVDEIASAANLLMGEAGDGTPAIVFRGLRFPYGGKSSVFMPEDKDVIRPFLRR